MVQFCVAALTTCSARTCVLAGFTWSWLHSAGGRVEAVAPASADVPGRPPEGPPEPKPWRPCGLIPRWHGGFCLAEVLASLFAATSREGVPLSPVLALGARLTFCCLDPENIGLCLRSFDF